MSNDILKHRSFKDKMAELSRKRFDVYDTVKRAHKEDQDRRFQVARSFQKEAI